MRRTEQPEHAVEQHRPSPRRRACRIAKPTDRRGRDDAISGVVRFAIIAGPAMAKTCAEVTLAGEFKKDLLLQFDDHAVVGGNMGQRVQPSEHVVAHMGQYQSPGVDLAEMRFERLQAEVVLDILS
jgi:hypothetical protein